MDTYCKTAIFIFALLFSVNSYAQFGEDSLVQISGVVVDIETAEPIPSVTIKNKTQHVDILADNSGYFSVEALPGDTLIFEAMAYDPDLYVVPQKAEGKQLGIIERLKRNAVILEEVTVIPFPSPMQFERVFLEIVPGKVAERTIRLNENLANVTRDKTNMQKYYDNYAYEQNRAVYQITGMAPPNNFINPVRWRNFINDWRKGKFTDQAMQKLEDYPFKEYNEEGIEDDQDQD